MTMSSARTVTETQPAFAAMMQLRPVAEVARQLGMRTEIDLPRMPGVVELARTIAAAQGLTATVEIGADEVCVRFSP